MAGGERRNLQRNASDPQQVRFAKRKAEQRADRFSDALRVVMSTAEGRVVVWELLERAGLFRSIWDPSARIHYNAGRQDYGHELLANVIAADEQFYELMEREARHYNRLEGREVAASQTPAASEETESNG